MGRPRRAAAPAQKTITFDPGTASPKQKLFYESRALYTCYGGAKGGGKTHAVRIKASLGAFTYPGIKILIIRKTFRDVDENHIQPLKKMLPAAFYTYNGQQFLMTLANGSTIKFGHWAGEATEDEYNGLEYDWIFIDEATQFSERAYQFLGGCLRGANGIPKRMYLTCNPGGVGHRWVKRLFIDKDYRSDPDDPEKSEDPADYVFIPATVDDNIALSEQELRIYKRMLSNMPEDKRRAYRYGDWSGLGGNYFSEFSAQTHVTAPFTIPAHWRMYRSFDYGLDMLACYWWAIDEDGRAWCVREWCKDKLIVPEAAKGILERTMADERVDVTWAPPDMWSKQKDTGRTMAEIFMLSGVTLNKAENNRIQGHMMMKMMLAPVPVNDPYVKKMFPGKTSLPGMMFFDICKNIIGDIQDIQADENNPDDCAKEPHEITHTVDGVRYFCVSRTLRTERPIQPDEDEEFAEAESYETAMCGGAPSASYIGA